MESEQPLGADDDLDAQPNDPRIRITKGAPWIIDRGRRERWSAPDFVTRHAVEVRQVGDPVLHAPARKPRIDKKELEPLVQRMFASMVGAHGIGIAAQQIGVPLRVVIIDVDGVGIVAVNPEADFQSAEVEELSEGCLSVRGLYGMLERPILARVAAIDITGKKFTIEGEGLGAQCMLHETDHTNGMLYVDRLRTRKDLFPVEPDEPSADMAEGRGDNRTHRSVSGHTRDEMERATSR
ncbi:MAG TPA: peptide deformylase [Candidatus Limnocylindria bacterium]|nr:peptide deformylase [Candidatus Limnocylindria bacterium]